MDRERAGLSDRSLMAWISVLIALKLTLIIVLSLNSRFVMDEFWQVSQSKFVFNGFFDTIWPGKAVGYAVFYTPAQWIGRSGTSTMLIGRLQTALLGFATVAMIYACARSIGENRLRALLIVLVLLSFSNFVERIFRTISEPIALFFATGALLVVLRGNLNRNPRAFVGGLLAGLSFLSTQKAIYFDLSLGIGLVTDAWLARHWLTGVKRGLYLVSGWLVSVAAYCIVFGGSKPFPVLQNLLLVPADIATRDGAAVYGGLRQYVIQTLAQNLLIYTICLTGLVFTAARLGRLDMPNRVALIFTVVISVLVFSHSEPWPYIFIMAQPFLALWVPRAWELGLKTSAYRRVAPCVLIAAIVISLGRNLTYLKVDNRAQLSLISHAESILSPDDLYFDGIGMLPDHYQSPLIWLDKRHIFMTVDEGTFSKVYSGISNSPPIMIIWNYRLAAIETVIRPLLRDRYIRIAPNIRIVGRRLQNARPEMFDVVIPRLYRLYNEAGIPLSTSLVIDGKEVAPPFYINKGKRKVQYYGSMNEVLLLPVEKYDGLLSKMDDDPSLFSDVYD